MEMRHAMLLVEHADHDAVKPGYLGHLTATMASSRGPIKKQDPHLLEALGFADPATLLAVTPPPSVESPSAPAPARPPAARGNFHRRLKRARTGRFERSGLWRAGTTVLGADGLS